MRELDGKTESYRRCEWGGGEAEPMLLIDTKYKRTTFLFLVILILLLSAIITTSASGAVLKIKGNHIQFDGVRGRIIYRDSGDLNGDGRLETVMEVLQSNNYELRILVGRYARGAWKLVGSDYSFYSCARADVTDINGDHKLEIVERGMTGDGHWRCIIRRLQRGRLITIGEFGDTKFRDLSGDGVPEVLSLEIVGAACLGDHWLSVYKWNGHGYTEVGRRYPWLYDKVIKDLKRVIYERRYTTAYGSHSSPSEDPVDFSSLYYYLGKAYEYRGLPDKARIQYAIAYRLYPTDEMVANAFRRTWKTGSEHAH